MSHYKKSPEKGLKSKFRAIPRMLALCFSLAAAPFAHAQETPAPAPITTQIQTPPTTTITASAIQHSADIALVEDMHLAYITSPSDRVNRITERGLLALGQTLNNRTSIEPASVIALDIERDDLTLFPFIYWPISANDTPLSPAARSRVQSYLDNGGMVLFDVRDVTNSLGSARAIAQIAGPLNLRPLDRLSADHTLTRSFYLLSTLRGSFTYDNIWVEEDGPEGTESVSNVIIGENNWAAAWAGLTLVPGTRDHELSLRAGVNMLMYAMTGNYKSDQVHINSTLDRIGRQP